MDNVFVSNRRQVRHKNTKTQQVIKMTERAKTISLDPDVHKALKLLCAENGWTMTQAVDQLMKIAKERNKDEQHGRSEKVD